VSEADESFAGFMLVDAAPLISRISGSSNHTIKVVNLATPGRPRIDVDG
jgi:hypothetical protein